MRRIILTFIMAIALLPGAARAEENNYIAVKGIGTVKQWPDFAVLSGRARGDGDTPAEAAAVVTQALAKMVARFKDLGVGEEDIAFEYLVVDRDVERVRQPNGEYATVKKGYVAVQVVSVTVRDLGLGGSILAGLIEDGAEIEVSGTAFGVNDQEALRVRARAAAIEDARNKAQAYADGMGRKLGRILIVEESELSDYRLVQNLRDEVSGVRSRYPSSAYAPQVGVVFMTPQPVTAAVAIYAKFSLR